jgi:uncharacterized protein
VRFSAATKGASPIEAVASFLDDLRESALPVERELVPELDRADWPAAFRVLASVLPQRPCVVVLDELPWLAEQDERFDGALQTAWDRLLSAKPVLLLLLGSDLRMMERLTAYDRPFFGRADNLVLGPLNPADVARSRARSARRDRRASGDGGSAGHRADLAARHARVGVPAAGGRRSRCCGLRRAGGGVDGRVSQSGRLAACAGGGRRRRPYACQHRRHGRQPGGALPSGTLPPLLRRLTVEKQVLAVDEPLSTRPGKPALYAWQD